MSGMIDAPLAIPVPLEAVVSDGYEFIDGRLVEKPLGAEAGWIAARLMGLLSPYTSSRKLGLVFSADCGYQIFKNDPKKVRKPDVSFIASGRLPNDRPPRGNVSIPPDLAVEVISPNDITEETDQRVEDYFGAGTRLMWLLYPQTGAVWVLRKDGTGARLKGAQELSGEDVVPGFACPVQALFEGVQPS
jgi:Uma2 family endonuclease